MQFFSKLYKSAVVAVAAIAVTACGSSSHDNSAPQAGVRVVHAVADAPLVNVFLNDAMVLENFDFRMGTAVLSIDAGSYDVRVEAISSAGNIDVIDAAGVMFEADTQTTVYAAGNTSLDTIAPLLVDDPTDPVSAGSARAAVVHAASGVGEVAVFVTAPGAAIGASAPLGTFEFGETLGPVEVPADDYQVRVAVPPASGPFTDADVVFDAGTVTLGDGADLQLAAVVNTTNGDSPVSVVVLDGDGSADLFDVGTGSLVRVVHASPDTGAVDVVVNDDFMSPVVSGAVYTNVTGFLGPLPPASYNFKVAPTGTMNAALDFDAALEQGRAYTVLAYDLFAGPIKELVLVDDNRRFATDAKLRIVHASPAAGNVDIYLLAPGALPSDSGVEPSFAGVPFGAETGFFGVPAGTYDAYVTPEGDPSTLAISATGVSVSAAGLYTIIARDAAGGGAPLGLILADDFVL